MFLVRFFSVVSALLKHTVNILPTRSVKLIIISDFSYKANPRDRPIHCLLWHIKGQSGLAQLVSNNILVDTILAEWPN